MPVTSNIERIFLSVEQVALRLGVSTDTIYRWRREGKFPKAAKLSPGTVRWRMSDIEAWEQSLETCFVTCLDFAPLAPAFIASVQRYAL